MKRALRTIADFDSVPQPKLDTSGRVLRRSLCEAVDFFKDEHVRTRLNPYTARSATAERSLQVHTYRSGLS